MNHLWDNVFEYFKERRLAAVFFGTLLGLIGTFIGGAILFQAFDPHLNDFCSMHHRAWFCCWWP